MKMDAIDIVQLREISGGDIAFGSVVITPVADGDSVADDLFVPSGAVFCQPKESPAVSSDAIPLSK